MTGRCASNFNRAFKTAVLAGFKDIEKTTDLTEGGLVVSPDENSRRAAALHKMLAQMPEKGKSRNKGYYRISRSLLGTDLDAASELGEFAGRRWHRLKCSGANPCYVHLLSH